MATYATPDELRARTGDTADTLSDATAEGLLERAERRLDRLAGAWPIRPSGLKFDPTTQPSLYVTAVREATLDLAEAERKTPSAFNPPAAKRVRGPDFELVDVAGVPPAGQAALRDAAARLDALGLRALTARGAA